MTEQLEADHPEQLRPSRQAPDDCMGGNSFQT